MLLLDCPNCGPRNLAEFRYGGEARARPADPGAVEEVAWADFLYLQNNACGVQTEWWYHRLGCGLWFLAERHTLTNQVQRTRLWKPAGAPDEEQADA